MLTPDIALLKQQLDQAFNSDASMHISMVFQFCFDQGESYYVTIDQGKFDLCPGTHKQPTVTLLFDRPGTAQGILDGSIDGMQAFMQGKFRNTGNLVLASRLGLLFAHTAQK